MEVLLEDAKLKLEVAECNFNYASGRDIDIAIAELNAAEVRLNRVYEIAKEGIN